MNILYFVFGEKMENHIQVTFSMRTFMAQMGSADYICIITDHPQFYCAVAESHVRVLPVTQQTLVAWQGKHHFFWRAKLKAIEHTAQLWPEDDLLYLDGDTVLHGSLDTLKATLKAGTGMMHLDEGHPSAMISRARRMWRQVGGHCYDSVTLGMEHHMWNAGVVGIPAESLAAVCRTALALCDGMLADGAEPVVVEQWSLSVAMKERCRGLQPADSHILHYWGNKDEWTHLATDYLLRQMLTKADMQKQLAEIRSLDFGSLPYYVKYPSMRSRLMKLISRWFPARERRYAQVSSRA